MLSTTQYYTKNIISHFNRAANSYDDVSDIQKKYIVTAIQQLSQYVSTNATIGDIGCGTGAFSKHLKPTKHSWNVLGIDLASAMCQKANPYQTYTSQADIHNLPVASNVVDAACCFFTLQWSNDPKQALKELTRIVKPGGYVAILSFVDGTLKELSHICEKLDIPNKTNAFHSAKAYSDWLIEEGLTFVEEKSFKEEVRYDNARDLFSKLKKMGATNSNTATINGLGNRSTLKSIETKYQQEFSTEDKIIASWEIGFWLYKK